MKRLAFIVSHPIQYYVPLYRRLAKRGDLQVKVFYTWHGGGQAQLDRGFGKNIAWDIPLTDGYEFDVVPNTAQRPGTHRFWGVRNPSLVQTVSDWKPDVVHITGYAYASHLRSLRALPRQGVPVLFRGDSHLLDGRGPWWRWWLKRSMLQTFFRWPAAFLCVGRANRDYYRAFGLSEEKLFDCPHSIETERFAEPSGELEERAAEWRRDMGIGGEQKVVLFAGKFEDKKRPVQLVQAFLNCKLKDVIMILVGDGVLGDEVRALTARHPAQFRVLPFQNQSKMPLSYRLADLLVLPSGYGETWGLAVNEAMACGRPALVSDRVGCHPDVIKPEVTGGVFAANDWQDFQNQLRTLLACDWRTRRTEIRAWAKNWSIEKTEDTLIAALNAVL